MFSLSGYSCGVFQPLAEVEGKGYLPRSQLRFLRNFQQASYLGIIFMNVMKDENTHRCLFK